MISDNYTIRLSNNNYFVMDHKAKQIYRFNSDGEFLNKIGEPGKGPKELFRPSDFFVDEKKQTVEILCEPGSTVKKYTLEGNYISKFNFNFPSHSFTKNTFNEYFFYRGVNSGYSEYRLTITDDDGIKKNIIKDNGKPPIGLLIDKALESNQDKVLIREALLNQIWLISRNKNPKIFKLDVEHKNINEKFLKEYNNVMTFFNDINQKGFYSTTALKYFNNELLLKVKYQQKNQENLKIYYVFYNTLNNKCKKIEVQEKNIATNKLKLHEFLTQNKVLFSIDAYHFKDFYNSHSKELFIKDTDNPVLIIMEKS